MGDVTCREAKKAKPLLASGPTVGSLDFILNAVAISMFSEEL